MTIRKLLLAGSAFAVMAGAPAQASIVDNPHFKVLGLVIVWGADAGGNAPIASDFIIDSDDTGSNDADLIAGDVHTVVTGSLTPTPDSMAGATPFDVVNAVSGGTFNDTGSDAGVLDASDSFDAFTLDETTDITADGATFNSSFYVASNTDFAIDAVASETTATNFSLADVGYALSVTRTATDGGLQFGQDAQFPHSGGASGGVVGTVDDLNDMSGGATNVFTGNQRTALTPGSIVDQSVRFDAEYKLGGTAGYDLSDGVGEIEANVTYTVYVP